MKNCFTLVILSITVCVLSVARVSVAQAEECSVGVGEIRYLDLVSRTCVVEVPIRAQLFTVGGFVSPEASLKKGGLKTGLEDFKVGDKVKTGWCKGKSGHRIYSLDNLCQSSGVNRKKEIPSRVDNHLLGIPQRHVIQNKETLLDIARQYNLGYNEIQDLYPQLDPWIPPVGMELIIPSQRILPDIRSGGIVINVAEFRLYYFMKGKSPVMTFPVGLGDREWTTPLGEFRIGEKRTNPTWYIPPSLQHKYPIKAIPPGPDNPLGDYWMGLEGTSYGIHGTDIPWSIGRLVTHGCIRMYPEDIPHLFNLVKPGTAVSIIYEPIKIGLVYGRVYVEVHRDIYDRIEDMNVYGIELLREKGLLDSVDLDKFKQALDLQDGLPRDITL